MMRLTHTVHLQLWICSLKTDMLPSGTPYALASSTQPASARTTASTLEAAIRHDLMRGVFPAGAKLRIRELSERYEAGAIPLREALSRLSNSGFVVAVDQKGFRVADVSVAELLDITQTRQRLETMALRDAILSRNAAWESQVLAAAHQLASIPETQPYGKTVLNPEWEQAHVVFHEVLVAGCPSAWIRHFCGVLRDQTARYRALSMVAPDSRERDIDAEHAAIVQAILDQNADAACELLSEHFSETAERVMQIAGAGEAG